jgi:hypothetical protein
MPSMRQTSRREYIKGENESSAPAPDGIYSGMTKGLARQGEGFCQVEDAPKDSRMSGVLQDQNQYYNDDADPD